MAEVSVEVDCCRCCFILVSHFDVDGYLTDADSVDAACFEDTSEGGDHVIGDLLRR